MTGTPAGVAALASGDQLSMTLHGQSQILFGKLL
jgi:2-keto-4-pentenoate hydratase/2-oxohepta-3-ene-1,7-dioic acid hydratase in catechol pathway